MEYKVKLSCTIPLDSCKEADMVKYMQEMKARHKLGDMVANCVRFCWEHREELEKLGFEADKSGLTDLRDRYFKSIDTSISEMKQKVDKIYDMAFKTYILAQFNKQLGLEDKSKNSLSAQFMLERQVDEITKTLGLSDINHVWESNRQSSIEDKSKKVLEYILEAYDGIVSELKSNNVIERLIVREEQPSTYSNENSTVKETQEKKVIEYSATNSTNNIKIEENEEETTEEPIDFDGNADIDLLTQFIGL